MCDDLTDTTDVFRVAVFEYSPLNENIESYEKMEKVISEFDGRSTEYTYPLQIREMESSSISNTQITHNSYGYDSIISNSSQYNDSETCGDSLLRSNLSCQSSYEDYRFQPLKEITAEQKNQINSTKFMSKFPTINEETKNKEEPEDLNFAELSRQMYLQCQNNMHQQQQLEQIRQNGIVERLKKEKEQINLSEKENNHEIQENSQQQKLQLTKKNRQVKWTDEQLEQQQPPLQQSNQGPEKGKENTINQPPAIPPSQPIDPKSECLQKGMCKIKELGDTIRSSLQTMHEKFKEVKTCVSLIADEDKHKEQWDTRLSDFYNKLFNSASQALFTSENAIKTPGKLSTRKPMSVVKFNAKPPSAVRFQKISSENSAKPPSTMRFQIPVKKSIQKPQSVVKFSKPASTTKFNPPSMLNRQLNTSKQNTENAMINQKQQQQQPYAPPVLQRQKSFTVQKFQVNNKAEPVGVLKMSKDIKKEQQHPQPLKLKSSFFRK